MNDSLFNMKMGSEFLIVFNDCWSDDLVVSLNEAAEYMDSRIDQITNAVSVGYELGYDVRSSYASGYFVYAKVSMVSAVFSFADSSEDLVIESNQLVADVILPEMCDIFGGYEVERIVDKKIKYSDLTMV